MSAYDHFLQFGAGEGRSPLSLFDPEFYLSQNPDVAAAVAAGLMTATEHFLEFGQGEPRQINPFINLGDYMDANADLADASAAGIISPLTHLLTHGVGEGRDLGNGINLGVFANDPEFQNAVSSGNFQDALDRVAEVAPFLPTFEPPANWAPPADTPIPTNFTPPEGTKMVIPPSVVVPDGQELPDSFEPVVPPAPEPAPAPAPTPTPAPTPAPTPGGGDDGGGGGGGGGNPPPTTVALKDSNAVEGKLTADFEAGITTGVIDLQGISKGQWVIVKGADLTTLTVKGSLETGGGAFYLDVGDQGGTASSPAAEGNATKLKTVNLALTGDPVDVWQWGTNAFNIESLNASGSSAPLKATIHAGGVPGSVSLKNLTGGSKADTLAIDPHAFKEDTLSINMGNGDDVLTFDGILPTTTPFTFDNEAPKASMIIDGGAGNDQIHIAVGGIATGGLGADSFIIRAKAGITDRIEIKDYDQIEDDIIDLTKITGLNLNELEVRKATNDGRAEHKGWTWGSDYQGNDLGVWTTDDAALIQITDAAHQTITFQIDLEGYTTARVNISQHGFINSSSSEKGEYLIGGDGDQTIWGGSGADIMTGGAGNNTFKFLKGSSTNKGGAESDRITDLSVGDIIDLTGISTKINLITNTIATSMSGAGISFTDEFDVFVGTIGDKSYLFYETTAQGNAPTDAGSIEAVGIDIVGTLQEWTAHDGVIAIRGDTVV